MDQIVLIFLLLLKVTKVTTEHQKWPDIISIINLFCPKGKKSLSLSPAQDIEESPRSGQYLLVFVNKRTLFTDK